MVDLNKDGKIDKFERKHYSLLMGRSFFVVMTAMAAIVVLALLEKGSSAFPSLVGITAVYAGRAIGSDLYTSRKGD